MIRMKLSKNNPFHLSLELTLSKFLNMAYEFRLKSQYFVIHWIIFFDTKIRPNPDYILDLCKNDEILEEDFLKVENLPHKNVTISYLI